MARPRAAAQLVALTMGGALPNFLIVGAMKSGTTSLATYVGDHPQGYMVPEKELRFFDHHFERGLDWYRECFSPPDGARAIGEATPTYLEDPAVAPRIASALPGVRCVATLREPVDRAYSHYWHWRNRMGERREFADVVRAELADDRRTAAGRWDPEHPDRYSYLAPGRYEPQLERLAEHVPRERLHVVLFEELEAAPVDTFKGVCDFLGLDTEQVPESVGTVANPYLYYSPAWLWAIFVRVRIGRWIPGRAASRLYRAMVRTGDPYPPMDPDLRERLRASFAPDNRALEAWLGRPLPAGWSR